MIASEALSLKDLRRQLFQALDSLPAGTEPVIKAIPVAFPIIEADYTLDEYVPEPIGLVRRAVLRAVCEFGPCDAGYVNDLLGLGADIIEQTLLELARSVPGLAQIGKKFAAGPECSKLVTSGRFERLVTQERRFVVNGLTDQLLPVEFWRSHQAWRLYPDPANPNGAMRTESGQSTPVLVRIVDRGVTGQDHLQQLVESGEAQMRQKLGVPAGVCERITDPLAIRAAWVLGFLLLRSDDSMEVVSARRQPTTLLDRTETTKEYMRHACQGLKLGLLESDRPIRPGEKWHNRWPQGTQIDVGRTRGVLLVRLPQPAEMLDVNWEDVASLKVWQILLEQGRDWDPFTFALYRIEPGDLTTSKTMALLRGIRELRHILRPLELSPGGCPPFDLAVWWQEWQVRFSKQVAVDLAHSPVTAEQFLRAADRVKDTDFQEKLEWLRG